MELEDVKNELKELELRLCELDRIVKRLRLRWLKYWDGEGLKPTTTIHQKLYEGAIDLYQYPKVLTFMKQIMEQKGFESRPISEIRGWVLIPIMPRIKELGGCKGVFSPIFKTIGCYVGKSKKHPPMLILLHELAHLLNAQPRKGYKWPIVQSPARELLATVVSNTAMSKLGLMKGEIK